jgi:TonB family protein
LFESGGAGVPKLAETHGPAVTDSSELNSAPSSDKLKLPVFLVTSDDSLWSQIGGIGNDWIPKQVDSIDELVATTRSGQAGAVLWDARGCRTSAAALSHMQLHSDRFAIIALDDAGAAAWTLPIEQRQVAAHVPLPVVAENLIDALKRAREEINARVALLGNGAAAASPPPGGRKFPWAAAAIVAGVLGACAATFVLMRHDDSALTPKSQPGTARGPQEPGKAAAAVGEKAVAMGEKVDALIDRARQAMLDRHYLDPAEGSALSLYRDALILDPSNGEAAQGLQRLAEILFARVQSALDERKFDVALQALETARSISPGDRRLAILDERVASLRAELGPAQIQAALSAQNFDRAVQLIDEAARAKALSGAKLNQLRDEVRRRREQFDVGRFVTLIDARLQQDRLIDPRNDSAAYYLNQARQAGASTPALQSQNQEFLKRSMQAAHGAIDQRRFGDAERFLAELQNSGAPGATLTALQRDLTAARTQPAHEKNDQPQLLELARARLAQGNVIEPENDSALHYVNQLRAVDPQNGGLAQISGAVQGQILARARSALDAADTAKAEAMLRLANGLGASADVDALNERLLQAKLAASGVTPASAGAMPEVTENSLTRLKSLQPLYPRQALAHSTEGWVEIGYTVTPAGKVIDVKTLNSNPTGVFEAAATEAVSRLRYKPFLQGGKAIAVGTKIRVAFRIAA